MLTSINFGDMIINLLNYGVIKLSVRKLTISIKNPVEAGLVFRAEAYKYSSAVDYSGEKGLLDNTIVFRMFDL
ncbi:MULTISPECIES: hypothetical protein [Chryseobacterium]|uniref:hypothetical protein n=1 Tax=Chryseobacterium TaxID=59732 RepID=UPI000486C0F9|nr:MULTISPECIES: hypothetical protein [Chryseobacterium]